jgi:hypothetical protein
MAKSFENGRGRVNLSAIGLGHPGLDLGELHIVQIERLVVARCKDDDFGALRERALELDSTTADPTSHGVHAETIALRGGLALSRLPPPRRP